MRPTPHRTREILWEAADRPGLEFARITESSSVVQIDGTVLGAREGVPFRLRYAINCSPKWVVQAVVVNVVCTDLDDLIRRYLLVDGPLPKEREDAVGVGESDGRTKVVTGVYSRIAAASSSSTSGMSPKASVRRIV